jgi:SAM-dependent methyltransferase
MTRGDLRSELLPFTAHNIELPDGTRTVPEVGLLADDPYCQAVLRTLRLACPVSPDRQPRVVDLGCLEGGFALEFARAGYQVLGIEARRTNLERCRLVADAFRLPNLSFILDDARNLARHGPFDAVFCAGLLYHLDDPVAFLQTVAGVTTKVLLLQTHYAVADDQPTSYPLSELCWHEGRLGRWFTEWDPCDSPEEIEHNSWASVGNSVSFWMEKKHLLATLVEVGFSLVFEQYDFLGDIVENDYIERYTRSLFVAIKE